MVSKTTKVTRLLQGLCPIHGKKLVSVGTKLIEAPSCVKCLHKPEPHIQYLFGCPDRNCVILAYRNEKDGPISLFSAWQYLVEYHPIQK